MCCELFADRRLLRAVRVLLACDPRLLSVLCCLVFVILKKLVCRLFFVACSWLFVVCYLLSSLLRFDCSLLCVDCCFGFGGCC